MRGFSRPTGFPCLPGLQLGIGAAGGLLATAPLAYATAAIGWWASFAIIAAAMIGLALRIAAVVSDPPLTSIRRNLAPKDLLTACAGWPRRGDAPT